MSLKIIKNHSSKREHDHTRAKNKRENVLASRRKRGRRREQRWREKGRKEVS